MATSSTDLTREALTARGANDVEKGLQMAEGPFEDSQGSRHSSPARHDGVKEKKKGSGLTEGDADMDELPKNNMFIVMPSIGLVLFLAALDMSIVSTALPTIAEQLGATPSEYSWVGTAYTLGMTMQTPLNGRVSDIVGRKPMAIVAIVIFFIFSALCGAAKSITWLIAARAFQGLGGGMIVGLMNILVSDIVPLSKRGMYQGWVGATWGIASVLGPVFGGLLTEKAGHGGWRWCFYINLPTCGIAGALLFFTLNLNPIKKHTFAELRRTFDFLGMALVMIGAALVIVGFSEASDLGFGVPRAYVLIVVGVIVFGCAVVNCIFTKRMAVIPARMFKTRTTLLFLIASLLHALAFFPVNYLLPQMFQGVRGSGALQSGIDLLPFAVIVSLGTAVAGMVNSRLRIVRPVVWVGYGLSSVAFALFYKFFQYPFTVGMQEGLQVLAGVGVGLSLQVPMLIVQAAMPLKDMASATTAWLLTRSLGGSIGLAIFTAVLNTSLRSKFEKIPGYGTDFTVPESAAGYQALHLMPEGPTKDSVLGAFSDSLGYCWLLDCGLFGLCLVLTLWTRSYSLNRVQGKAAAESTPVATVTTAQGGGGLAPGGENTEETSDQQTECLLLHSQSISQSERTAVDETVEEGKTKQSNWKARNHGQREA